MVQDPAPADGARRGGLILLLERPIRVGDVVTVSGTTGTVTKIRIRATTITTWDRQAFVVPNKSLVTGSVLNWTLNAGLNRIAIPVALAGESDSDTARDLLLKIAEAHPRVLARPAPMVTVEGFGANSMHLVLYAYLADIEQRASTITDLHTEIDRRFAQEGIRRA